MARLSLLLVVFAACGGVQIPEHNGYRSDKATPWKKPKTLKFDAKLEAKAEGELSYVEMKRAAWYAIDLDTPAALDLRLEITPPGDAVNDDFDLGFEVLAPGYRVISRADLEEGDQQHELNKTKALLDLQAGRYLVHLYLQGRLDSADYILHVTVKPSSRSLGKSDFPAQVPFPSPLAIVPLSDDTPKSYRAPIATVTHTSRRRKPVEPPSEPSAPPTSLTARIIGISVVGGGTQITVGRGTASGAQNGMHVRVSGIPDGDYVLGGCTERACTATVRATPAQIKGSASVTITSPSLKTPGN